MEIYRDLIGAFLQVNCGGICSIQRGFVRSNRKRPGSQRRDNGSASGVPALVCEHKQSYCGYKGRVEYHCEPRTVYQKAAREKESTDLQHFTKTVKARKVDRYASISLLRRLGSEI